MFKVGDKVVLDKDQEINMEHQHWDYSQVRTITGINKNLKWIQVHPPVEMRLQDDWLFTIRFKSAEPELFHEQLEKLTNGV